MKQNPYSGKFIVFEGLDGSGQSTQVKFLGEFLKKKGQSVILTKEPTSASQAGKKIRKVLDEKIKIAPDKLQQLFVQDRREHLENLIESALKQGKIVISDRYFFSTIAYGAIDLDLEWLIELNNDFLLPDIIFFLNVRPAICLDRIKKRGQEKTLFEKREKLAKVRQHYQILLKRFNNIYIINGELLPEEVFEQIKKVIVNSLGV